MSGLIRGPKFAGPPLVLTRDGAAGLASHLQDVSSPADAWRPEPAVPPEPRMTYAEFAESLGERLDAKFEEAREQGLKEGREQGQGEMEAAHAEQLAAMKDFLRDARQRLGMEVVGLAEVASEVVYEAVIKILGQTSQSPEGVAAIVHEVIRGAKDRSRLLVRVRRADFAWIQQSRDRILDGLDTGSVEFVADDRVILGGCILETPMGNLDGRLETQLAGLRELLLTARPHGEVAP
jgi:flagellar assembly protein FliH